MLLTFFAAKLAGKWLISTLLKLFLQYWQDWGFLSVWICSCLCRLFFVSDLIWQCLQEFFNWTLLWSSWPCRAGGTKGPCALSDFDMAGGIRLLWQKHISTDMAISKCTFLHDYSFPMNNCVKNLVIKGFCCRYLFKRKWWLQQHPCRNAVLTRLFIYNE